MNVRPTSPIETFGEVRSPHEQANNEGDENPAPEHGIDPVRPTPRQRADCFGETTLICGPRRVDSEFGKEGVNVEIIDCTDPAAGRREGPSRLSVVYEQTAVASGQGFVRRESRQVSGRKVVLKRHDGAHTHNTFAL